ncbi:MAG: ABC transporter permease [Acholeplasmataceae bacterium]|nr:ABC transporter permease [Acidaminococcaceae bacterium]NLY83350.1 ABC transporter permease [Acholeplasmataceae bacterium]
MTETLIVSILAASITAGTPILFAALGELITERSGIMNLGVDGMMLVGAVTGFMVAVNSGNPWLGVAGALVAGGLLALLHAYLTITLRANQVVSGLALTLFGTGLSDYLGKAYVGMRADHTFGKLAVPFLSEIPIIGPVVFKQDALVYLSYLLVILTALYLYKTRAGLFLRALGENPAAVDSVGVNVFRLRYVYVVVGGALAGLGGAYLSLAYAPCWLENMTAGRGWIAVALVIFAIWDPWRALAGSYLFGGVDALGFHLQVIGLPVSIFLLNMLPYIFTILVLIIVLIRKGGRLASPQALSVPYDREER